MTAVNTVPSHLDLGGALAQENREVNAGLAATLAERIDADEDE